MSKKTDWQTVKGHAGLQFRQYDDEFSFRFRQRQHKIDFLGVMPLETALRIAAELRENRATGAGPQTFKEMQLDQQEEIRKEAIVKKRERKRIIAEEKFEKANTVASFWDNTYWPERQKTGSKHNNLSVSGVFNNHIRPVIGDIALQDLKFPHVDEMLNAMREKGLSEKTVRHAYTVLQAEWNYAQIYLSAHNNIILPVFPGKMIKLPKLNNQKTCWLEKHEAHKLLDTLYNWRQICERHGIVQRGEDTKEAYGMAVLSLFSGLRLGDICKLTWRDVETAFAYARNPKGGRAYGIHLDIPVVREMLEERRTFFPKAKPTDYVFLDSNGKQWREAPQAFEDAVEELCLNYTPRRINNPLEKIDFHALRHTFASWLAMNGTNLQEIMVLMGHESVQMTLRYARLNPQYTKKSVEEMAQEYVDNIKLLDENNIVDASYKEVPQLK